nr:helix-turn-helix domain-containing protein [Croceicoccus hydrothermalis]
MGSGSRSEAAKLAGVTLEIVGDWVLRFNDGGPGGLAKRKEPGRASLLKDAQRARLSEMVETGPIQLSITRHTIGRELRAMG